MPFDGLFAAAVRHELNDVLADARIDKIYQPTPYTIILHCRRPGQNVRLLLSADPRGARVHLTEFSPPNPLQAPAFCMLLRKYLDPGKIVSVEQVDLDRILHLVIDGFDDIGRPARRRLIAELTGRNSNIVLVDESSGRIIDAMRRASARVNRYRALLPGEEYVPPPPTEKLNPRTISDEDLQAFAGQRSPDEPAGRFLVAALDGVSPFAAEHIVAAAGIPPSATIDELPLTAFTAAARVTRSLVSAIDEGSFSPVLIENDEGRPHDFWAFPPAHIPSERVRPVADASQAVDECFHYRLTIAEETELRSHLSRTIGTALKRLRRKADALQADLDDAERAEEYRVFGELITANLHLVRQGSEATVPNYYADGELVTIPMDPSLHPAANAQKYFKRYNKAKTALRAVKEQLDATNADIAYLEQTLMHVETASDTAELREIESELAAADVLRNRRGGAPGKTRHSGRGKSKKSHGRGHTPPSQPLQVRASDGSRILVGRNNRQNDRLTLRIARPGDIWLHVKDRPGAHVILQPADGSSTPSDDALREAAAIAAYFSSARNSGNVPVDWTLAKHVRKPTGARPGMVIYDEHKTIYVTPDEKLMQVLSADAGSDT